MESNIKIEKNKHNDVFYIDNPTSDVWTQAADIEYNVFKDSKYILEKEDLKLEYDKYIDFTGFLLTKHGGVIEGVVRVILNNEVVGFKTLNDVEEDKLKISYEGKQILDNIPKEQMMEVGTISIPHNLRAVQDDGFRVVTDLYGGIYSFGKSRKINYVLASYDEDYLQRFGKIFGPSIIELGVAKEYMGSPTIPAVLDLDRALESIGELGLDDTYNYIANMVVKNAL